MDKPKNVDIELLQKQFNCNHEWGHEEFYGTDEELGTIKKRVCIKCNCVDYIYEKPYELVPHIPEHRGDLLKY